MASRNKYFDSLRGVSILMVVAIHVMVIDNQGIVGQFLVNIRQLLNIAVPLFFAISGFFLAKKNLDNWSEMRNFWIRQIPKVYIPAILWSLPLYYFAIRSGFGFLNETVWLLCCGYGVFYFVAVIVQFYLLLPLLTKIRFWGAIGSIVISMASIIGVVYSGLSTQVELVLYAGFCPLWVMFFCMGIYLSGAKRNYPIVVLSLLFFVSWSLQYWEFRYLSALGLSGMGIKPTSFVFSAIGILLLFSKRIEGAFNTSNFVSKTLCYLGDRSFGIYLIHFIVLIFAQAKSVYPNSWVLGYFFIILITLTIIELFRFVLPKRVWKYLGI